MERIKEKMATCYKIVFYVPAEAAEKVKAALFAAGAGRIGNYDSCCWQTVGAGQFRGNEDSQPQVGEKLKVEKVEEYKVELVCLKKCLKPAIKALLAAHPYETPAYQYWKVKIC
jgi:hypothetical protein